VICYNDVASVVRIIGFDDIGNSDDFHTNDLECRLQSSGKNVHFDIVVGYWCRLLDRANAKSGSVSPSVCLPVCNTRTPHLNGSRYRNVFAPYDREMF